MIAVDTNILVYAHRSDSVFYEGAETCLRSLSEGVESWAIPWPCIHEFFAIVTHPRIYSPPSTLEEATAQIGAWMESPSLVLLGESDKHWETLSEFIQSGKVVGPMVHDARVAAICFDHGIKQLYSADRDFNRFPRIKMTNPVL